MSVVVFCSHPFDPFFNFYGKRPGNLPCNVARVDAGNFNFDGFGQRRSGCYEVDGFDFAAEIYDDKIRRMIVKTPKNNQQSVGIY